MLLKLNKPVWLDFSMLMPDISPVIFRVGVIQVTWYALVYVIGFALALVLLLGASRRKEIEMSEGQVYDFVLLAILGMMVGARAFHVLFWGFDYYLTEPFRILELWKGGFSFHGGLIGIFLVSWFYCKDKKTNFWKVADILALLGVAMPIFSRATNFINQEIVGTLTDVPWCFEFAEHPGCRHPVQLYAAFGRTVFLFFVLDLRRRLIKWKEGFIFWIFIFGIGLGRFFLDFWRADLRYFGLSFGQWFSVLMVLVGGLILWRDYRKDLRKIVQPKSLPQKP